MNKIKKTIRWDTSEKIPWDQINQFIQNTGFQFKHKPKKYHEIKIKKNWESYIDWQKVSKLTNKSVKFKEKLYNPEHEILEVIITIQKP